MIKIILIIGGFCSFFISNYLKFTTNNEIKNKKLYICCIKRIIVKHSI